MPPDYEQIGMQSKPGAPRRLAHAAAHVAELPCHLAQVPFLTQGRRGRSDWEQDRRKFGRRAIVRQAGARRGTGAHRGVLRTLVIICGPPV